MCDFSEYGIPSQEWLAVEATLPVPPEMSLEEKKRVTNAGREAIAAAEMRELAGLISQQDFMIPTRDGRSIEARLYIPNSIDRTQKHPVYIHIHGGGFLFGTLSSEDAICSRIAIATNVLVFNINYRHTPEFVFPTAWLDVQDAFIWAHANMDTLGGNREQVIVGGISAGAQLTASLVLEQHLGLAVPDLPAIKGQVLMIPCVAHIDHYDLLLQQLKDPSLSSYKQNVDAPILSVKTVHMFTGLLLAGTPGVQANDTKINIGNATKDQVQGLPPAAFGIAGLDPLRDEGLLYAKLLTESDVPTDITVFKGVPHGFRRFGEKLSESKRWDKTMEDGIRWILSNPTGPSKFAIKS